jgi:uncharacterized protein
VEERLEALKRILAEIGPCLVAFSGGVDSTFLLRVARDVLGNGVTAVTAVSASLSAAERDEAVALARAIGARHLLIDSHELDDPRYARNDAGRCYFCKKELFAIMTRLAGEAGGRVILYGAIPDDLGDDRPGMRAAAEARARAPLLEAGLTKEMVRALSKRLGLPTWDKPAMACLASRLQRFTPVTAAALARVERAEQEVRALGYRQVRVRVQADASARLELDPADLGRALAPAERHRLTEAVRSAGFIRVAIDPAGYRPGGRGLPAASPRPA